MARAIGVCRLHDRARIDVHDDGSIVGLIDFRWLRPMAAASGVGGLATRSDCEDGGQAKGAPASPTTAKVPPTRHPFCTSLLRLRSSRPLSWSFCIVSSGTQFMTVRERGLQILKAIHWILRNFRTAINSLDFLCSAV